MPPSFTRPNRVFKKLTLLLLVAAALHIPVKGLTQSITFSAKRVTMLQAFAEIKKQTSYVVVYNPELIDTTITFSIQVKNQPLEEFMKAILANRPLSYAIVSTTIVVFAKVESKPRIVVEESELAGPPVRDIAGVVYDEKNTAPIAAVSVVVNGAGKGTQTDERGAFLLKKVNENDKVSFTIIGYETVTMPVKKMGSQVYIPLKIATNELDQAVVQAYGITSKRMATGNISKVTAEEIEKQPVMNPILALMGKVPGLVVTQTSGHASSPVRVEIRGRNSINPNFSSEPLYIIDGVPLTVLDVNSFGLQGSQSQGFVQGGLSVTGGQSPLFSMNPKDIESIEVLKDADATAIYGSRAASGVILITTKKARPGKTTFSLNLTQGIINIPRRIKMLNTSDYLAMRREAFKNDGITPTAANAPDLLVWDTTRYTDWQKELLGTGKQTAVAASLSGGDNRTSFSLRTNYTKQVDLMSRSGANQQATVSFSVRHRSMDQKLSVSLTANYGYTKVDAINDNGGVLNLAPNAPPVFNSKGDLNYDEWNAANIGIYFPFSYILKSNIIKTNNLVSSLNIGYELMRGLTLSTNAGFGSTQNTSDYLTTIASQNPMDYPTGTVFLGRTTNSNWILEPQLKYSRAIGEGSLLVQVGGSLQTTITGSATTFAGGYSDDNLIHSIGNALFQQTFEATSHYKYAALFGRITYNWGNKYMLNLNARRDGSSRFASGRQYGNFGSVGASWIASEEKWVKQFLPAWFSFLKFRSSFGITGSDAIGDYQNLSQWSTMSPSGVPWVDYMGIRAYATVHAVNQDYHWEQNKQWEGAVNLGFLQDRINLELAYYRKRSDNQLTRLPTPVFTGFTSVVANWIANVQNSGFEASLRARLIEKKDFRWSVSFNIGINRNKLLDYPGIEFSPYFTQYKVGRSLNTQYLFHYLGVDPQTGNYSFADYSKDGTVTKDQSVAPGTVSDDRYIALDLNPRYTGGVTTDVSYKGLSLSVYCNFKKQMGLAPFAGDIPGRMLNLPLYADIINNHWQKPGDNALYPRYSTMSGIDLKESDGAYTDASYFRLNTVAVSYALPDKWVKKAAMQGCILSFNVQNLFTITGYKGIDPELPGSSGLPSPRIFTSSLSFNF